MDQALRSRNYPDGQRLARTTLELARREKYRYGEVNSLTAMGFVFNHQAKYDSAVAMLEMARKVGMGIQTRPGFTTSRRYRDIKR